MHEWNCLTKLNLSSGENMNSFIKKGLSVLLIGMMAVVFGFTAQAKKGKKDKEPYLGPTIEECKTNKKGDERCKTKNLHGQKAIIYLYQLALEQGAAISANVEVIAELSGITDELRSDINALIDTVNDHEGRIVANEADIASILVKIAALQTIQTGHTQELQDLNADISEMRSETVAQFAVIQDQFVDLQGQIDANHAEMIALFADLNGVLAAQKTELESLINTEIAALETAVDVQIDLLNEKVDDVKGDLTALETAMDLAFANLQITLILADIQDLKDDLGDLNGTADDLADRITTNEGLISDMSVEIAANEAAIAANMQTATDLIDGLELRADALAGRIDSLEGYHIEFPNQCETGVDPGTGANWVVCSADENEAWISANTGGRYHAELICQNLGYRTVGAWGGTCGNVCGYCQGSTSCQNHGTKNLYSSWSNPNGGSDALGAMIHNTVSWSCVQ